MQVTWAEMHGDSSTIQVTQFNCYLRMRYAQFRAFQVAILLKNLHASEGDTGLIHRSGGALGGENDDRLQYLAREIPRTEEPSGLQSMGSQRFGHTFMSCPIHWESNREQNTKGILSNSLKQ